jgi:transketolase
MPKKNSQDLENLRNLRKNILEAASRSGKGHIPSSYSILEILYSIFVIYPKLTSKKFKQDFEFILSKGHASLGLYAILNFCDFIDDSWINSFSKFQSSFGGHPDVRKINQVFASTGSLGHGLPISVGKVLANRVKKREKKIFCLIGDGELNEGTNWESFLICAHLKLKELTIILDNNKSSDRSLPINNITEIAKKFDFKTFEIDGHDLNEISETFIEPSNFTKFVVANTTKGFGLPLFQNDPSYKL